MWESNGDKTHPVAHRALPMVFRKEEARNAKLTDTNPTQNMGCNSLGKKGGDNSAVGKQGEPLK